MSHINRRRLIICSILLSVNLVFIWGNSMLPGSVSGEISGSAFEEVSTFLTDFFHLNPLDQDKGEHLLRKLAHFTEFCWLGLTLTWFFLILEQKGIYSAAMPLLAGLLAACVDETIQCFTADRGSSLIDVWIDTAGVVAGIILLLFGHYLIMFRRKQD